MQEIKMLEDWNKSLNRPIADDTVSKGLVPEDSVTPSSVDKENQYPGAIPSHDCWLQEPGCWVRHHVRPRRAMFSPFGAQAGPPCYVISVSRITYVNYVKKDKATEIITDVWVGKESRRLLDEKWTGYTVIPDSQRQRRLVPH